ncbi:MAG: AMP-binding protein [Dehalococcoidia bacterium]|uniref:AMP-binding protein n=1 Tax=Candidatus Amarobacter glycogenicus TaxID=3140699 RepID=UPI00313588CC|nr:AMP-binding protein [Dehalococcoidia bacterium]
MNTLVDLLEQSARDFPQRTAVTMRVGVRTVKYNFTKLEERAHAYARFMGEQNVKKGDRVVIWAPNQPDWVAAMFGSFLAGAVVVPLDVRSTRDFVERVIHQTEPVIAFAGKAQADTLRELEIPSFAFETMNLPVNGRVAQAPLAPSDLAEIIFTSGTTGDPKGVMLSHANIVANVRAGTAVIPIGRDTRMLSLLPLSHMFEQIGGCFASMHVGAAVCYPASRQPAALSRTMQEWKPTFIMGVPQVLTLLMNGIEREATAQGKLKLLNRLRKFATPLPENVRRKLFRSVLGRFGGKLEMIASGGAAIDPEIQLKWEQMGVAVVEGYGTTECSPVVTINPRDDRRIRSVGKPLPGQQVRIAEDGEVLTRGPNVFSGYWKNEAASAAVFEGDWYRTGDLGYIEDGYLYLKGRKKDLIVLSDGQNVYPDDIEEVLRHQPGIADAVVLGLPDGPDIRLHAVLVESEAGAGPAAVKGANAKLSDRQQLFAWTIWPDEDFPRTHTLKVRRPLVQQFVTDQAPVSAVAAHFVSDDALLKLVASVRKGEAPIIETATLGLDLQLDSLGRVELLSAIEDDMGVYVDDTEVGPQTTVAQLRAMVEKGERKAKVRKFPTWPRRLPARLARRALMTGLVFPMLRLGYSVEIRGRHHFKSLQEPVLIISNHNMHLDGSMLLRSMPHGFRQRVAIAAAASDIFGNRFRGFGASLLGNAFPFAKEGSGVRDSLEAVAKMLDGGWNVLIFPEGKLTVGGPMQAFKSGTGLLAIETGVPVLPMRIDILRPGFYEGKWLPHPHGRVRVNIGPPITFAPGTAYAEATAKLEEAVRTA